MLVGCDQYVAPADVGPDRGRADSNHNTMLVQSQRIVTSLVPHLARQLLLVLSCYLIHGCLSVLLPSAMPHAGQFLVTAIWWELVGFGWQNLPKSI